MASVRKSHHERHALRVDATRYQRDQGCRPFGLVDVCLAWRSPAAVTDSNLLLRRCQFVALGGIPVVLVLQKALTGDAQ